MTRARRASDAVAEHPPASMARLRDALAALYGDQPHFAQWFDALVVQIQAKAKLRSASLKARDALAMQHPQRFVQSPALGYIAYVDRFGTNFAGVRARIPYLKKLGVTYLHLLPFLRARAGENDGGFAVSSFEDFDPRYGDAQDFADLTAALHGSNIALCADFVLNHIADDHPWACAARAGDLHYRKFFRVLPDAAEVAQWEAHLGQVFPQTAPGNFSPVPTMGGHVWTTFFPYQWDLNYAEPAVFEAMSLAMLDLANRGIDALRLDSTAFLWKQMGTACANLPQVHTLLVALRAIIDIAAPSVLLKAEAIMPRNALSAYFGARAAPECHLAYHSAAMAALWLSVAEQNAHLLAQVLVDADDVPEGAAWIHYLRCHDDIVWGVLRPEFATPHEAQARLSAASQFLAGEGPNSFARGSVFQASAVGGVHGTNGMTAALLGHDLERLRLVFGVLLALNGVPLIYMGDEYGQDNADARAATMAGNEDGRRLQRPCFDAVLAEAQSPVRLALDRFVRVRSTLPALSSTAALQVRTPSAPSVLAFTRGQDFLALANFSEHPASVASFLGEGWIDAFDARPLDATMARWNVQWCIRVGSNAAAVLFPESNPNKLSHA